MNDFYFDDHVLDIHHFYMITIQKSIIWILLSIWIFSLAFLGPRKSTNIHLDKTLHQCLCCQSIAKIANNGLGSFFLHPKNAKQKVFPPKTNCFSHRRRNWYTRLSPANHANHTWGALLGSSLGLFNDRFTWFWVLSKTKQYDYILDGQFDGLLCLEPEIEELFMVKC